MQLGMDYIMKNKYVGNGVCVCEGQREKDAGVVIMPVVYQCLFFCRVYASLFLCSVNAHKIVTNACLFGFLRGTIEYQDLTKLLYNNSYYGSYNVA